MGYDRKQERNDAKKNVSFQFILHVCIASTDRNVRVNLQAPQKLRLCLASK